MSRGELKLTMTRGLYGLKIGTNRKKNGLIN